MSEKRKPYRVEIRIDAPREEVWRAVREPGRIREWFGWDYDGIGPEIEMIFVGVPTEQPPERVDFGDGSHLELTADGSATVVRMIQPGSLDGTAWDDVYDGVEEGWRMFLEQLRFLLETGPRGTRRTVFLAGTTTVARARAAVDGAGPVWHTGAYLWMRVDPAGHLIALATQEPTVWEPSTPEPSTGVPGPVSVTVTTYGLDDPAFTAVREEWARRWRAVPEATLTTTTEAATPLAGAA
jgi:hypothetical protein